MVIICFFGPDGSGKSTLAKKLAEKIHKRGHKTKLSWMRGSHTFASLTAKILKRFDTFKGSENPYYNIKIPRKMKRFWQSIEFLSALPIIISEFLFPSLIGYQVLADRYTLDLAVWICLTTRDYSFLKRFEAKVLIALSKKTNAKFYVTTNIEELKRRTGKSWFSKEQLHLYYKLAETVDAHTIDTTNKSVDESLQEVLTVLKEVYPKIELRND
jgi:thymidylate kinase